MMTETRTDIFEQEVMTQNPWLLKSAQQPWLSSHTAWLSEPTYDQNEDMVR